MSRGGRHPSTTSVDCRVSHNSTQMQAGWDVQPLGTSCPEIATWTGFPKGYVCVRNVGTLTRRWCEEVTPVGFPLLVWTERVGECFSSVQVRSLGIRLGT